MSLVDRIKSLFTGSDQPERELPKQPSEPNGNARQPTPEEVAAAAAATPAVAQVEPFSAEPEPSVQPAGDAADLDESDEAPPLDRPHDPAP